MAKPKFTFPQLALLDWLCEPDGGAGRLLSSSGGGSGNNLYFFQTQKPADGGKAKIERVWPGQFRAWDPEGIAFLERFGGRDSIDVSTLYRAGFLKGYNALGHASGDQAKNKAEYQAMVAGFHRDPFHWSANVYLPTKQAHDYWLAEGKAKLAALRAARDAEKAAVERLILIGRPTVLRAKLPPDLVRRIPEGVHPPLPSMTIMRPYALARVVKQTDTRVYVRDVELMPELGESNYRSNPIEGNRPNQYVALDRIMLDHADAATARGLHAIDREYADDLQAMTEKLVESILPALSQTRSRMLQKASEREDAVRDLLGGRALNQGAPEPAEDEDDGYDAPSGP